MLGASGRAITEGFTPKWLHQGFQKSHHLFNYWGAKPHIMKNQTAILVEGPGNVLRFEEAGIHNSLAMFGKDISDSHQFLLERLGVMTLKVALDEDDAGRAGKEKIKRLMGNMYNLEFAKLPSGINDVGELSAEQAREIKWV